MDPVIARGIALAWHVDQRDGDGRPLAEHVQRVAATVPPEARAVGFLHAVIERTDVSYELLRAYGLTTEEASALELLTPAAGESYALYILRIAHAPGPDGRLARAVKLADLEEQLARGASARSVGAPPYAWAHRHIAIARERRDEGTGVNADATGDAA